MKRLAASGTANIVRIGPDFKSSNASEEDEHVGDYDPRDDDTSSR